MGTAVITRAKTGKKEYYSDGKKVSKSSYNKTVQKDTQKKLDRNAKRSGKKRSSARAEVIGGEVKVIGVEEAPVVAIDKKSGKKYTKTDLIIERNKALLQEQPAGSYKVTKADGTVVYRTSGQNAQGTYVNDVYQRLQKNNKVTTGTSTYSIIPKTAKKIKTKSGEVYRQTNTYNGQTVVTDYKPGGVKETKILTTSYRGGDNQFIPKPQNENKNFVSTTPALDIALNTKSTNIKAGESLANYSETLIKREKRLQGVKDKTYSFLRIKGKENAKWYNVLEVGKGVARVPFEIASLPAYIYGRGNFVVRSIFDKAGRQELKSSIGEVPGAVKSVYVTKNQDTGKYQFTAQNLVNTGLTIFSIRTVAKSPNNAGLKVFEKNAKTNIKGSIKGYQDSFVFKSAGKFKGRPYKELTFIKDGKSTSTISYQGKTFLVNRNAKGGGTYKITTTKTKLKVQRSGPIPKRFSLEKEVVTLKKGSFKSDGKPLKFKTEKGVTTQDIQLLDQRGLSKTYISYLEQLKTKASANAKLDGGLNFKASTNIKVNANLKGVVTNQRTAIKQVDFTKPSAKVTLDYKKPDIQFSNKPFNPKDVVIKELIKDNKGAITGTKQGSIIQPRSVVIGTKDAITTGTFTITGGKGFNFLSPLKLSNPVKGFSNIPRNLYNNYKVGQLKKLIEKNAKENQASNTFKITPPKRAGSKETTFDFSKSILQKSKPGEQIAVTEQALSFNIPLQTQAPKLQVQSFNFNLLNQARPGNNALPVFPVVSPSKKNAPVNSIVAPISTNKNPNPVFKVRTFQDVRPLDVTSSKTFIRQNQESDAVININNAQRVNTGSSQRPRTIIKQFQEQVFKPVQINSQVQVQKQKQVFKSAFQGLKTPSTPQPFQFKQPQIPTFLGGFKPNFNSPKQSSQGFNVYTRIKGVFKQANALALSKSDAINYGAYRVGNTSQATFKIVKANTNAQDVFKIQTDLKDFYKKDDLFIEKKGRRIKSQGELQEITFKGIQATKKKSIFGGKK